jgi:hypothetical protein
MSRFAPRPAVRKGQKANRRSPLVDRFWSKVEPVDGCWSWTGYVSPNGYGQIGVDRVVLYVHRWAYEHFIGPIPEGLHLDHLCERRNCCKPWHLEPVTQAENNRRAAIVRRLNAGAA